MKIALYHNLPSGGALVYYSHVVKALHSAGHELHLFAPETAEREFANFSEFLKSTKFYPRELFEPTARLPNPLAYHFHLRAAISSDRRIAKDIEKSGVDGVYVGQCRIWTEPPLLSFLPAQVPSVLSLCEPKRAFHEEEFLKERENWSLLKKMWRIPTVNWMLKKQRIFVSCADHVFALTRFAAENIRSAYPGTECEIFSPGVNTDFIRPSGNDPADRLKGEPFLLSVGALDPMKNHEMAVEVAGRVRDTIGLKVKIIGDRVFGDTEDRLTARARELGVGLEIQRRVTDTELVEAYQRAFAVVYCPIREPLGLTALEAQSAGTPVLGRAEGGLLETVREGRGGHLYLDDPAPYAVKLEEWASHPETYRKICSTAREDAAENWDRKACMTKIVKRMEELFSAKK